jgi:hypothetical protein
MNNIDNKYIILTIIKIQKPSQHWRKFIESTKSSYIVYR